MPVVKTELQKPCSERAQDSEINSGWGGLEGWGRGKTASVKGLPLEQGGSALHAGGGEWEGRAGRRCRVCSEVHCWAGLGNRVTGVRRAERQSGEESGISFFFMKEDLR